MLLNVFGCVWFAGFVVLASRFLIFQRRLGWLWTSVRSVSIPNRVIADVREAVGENRLPPVVTSDVAPVPLVLGRSVRRWYCRIGC